MNSRNVVVAVIAVVGGLIVSVLPRMITRVLLRIRIWRGLSAETPVRRPNLRALNAFHQLSLHTTNDAARSEEIDERTWIDLDLDDVFNAIDKTKSRVGQQYLYHLLRSPTFDRDTLYRLNTVVEFLRANAELLESVQAALGGVDDQRSGFLVDLMFGYLPERPQFWWLFPLLTAGSVSSLLLILLSTKAIVLLILSCVLNVAALLYYRPRVEALLPAIHEVPAFLTAARKLSALQLPVCAAELNTLRMGEARLGVLRRATRWLAFEPTQDARELVTSVYMYINILLLMDMNAFVFGIDSARTERPLLQEMFVAMGYLDAAGSIATIRNERPAHCLPEFQSAGKAMALHGITHPLVDHPVGNSFETHSASVLITGSNMSGKTTLVRALGVNATLAQTISTVFGTSWRAPFLSVNASIGRMDSVMEGKSYYLAEVESVRRLIRAKGDGRQHLFLLDEIFRGTNTEERVAAAFAVLEHLNLGNDIVVVATHDTELLDMLGDSYDARHFREHIADGKLTFDFTIRDGRATTRNAIALLELMEYPTDIVDRARQAVVERAG